MKRSPEKTVAALVALALVGLISVQAYWAKRTYTDAEIVFRDKVTRVLNDVRDESNNSIDCFAMYSKTYIESGEGFYMMKSKWDDKGEKKVWSHSISPDSLPMIFDAPEEYRNSPMSKVFHDLKFSTPVTAEILLRFRYDISRTSPEKEILSKPFSQDNFRDIMKKQEPLLSIYDTTMIDSLIRYNLKINNIPLDYSYAIVKTNSDTIEYSSNPASTKKILRSGIRTRLTPNDLFSKPYDIALYPYNAPRIILRNIIWILSLSIGIILLLLFAFIYFIRTILNQKKLSAMKSDFINNMTHELNTPIANISLAFETLQERNKISTDTSTIPILNIIRTETDRLKENVLRLLRISSYEKNGNGLQQERSEVSELIQNALGRLELKIRQKNAKIEFLKPDLPVYFTGDKHHLSNAFENLIDNALKYSNGDCRITVELIRSDAEIIIRVKDNGIGIESKEKNRIFEKFYRIQHGNIQNARGFGIGLNYVKNVIESHGGIIDVSSNPGKGSCFEITLNENERKD